MKILYWSVSYVVVIPVCSIFVQSEQKHSGYSTTYSNNHYGWTDNEKNSQLSFTSKIYHLTENLTDNNKAAFN